MRRFVLGMIAVGLIAAVALTKARQLVELDKVDLLTNVSQFWTFNPEEYLKQPVYSRDNPPAHP